MKRGSEIKQCQVVHTHLDTKIELRGSLDKMSMSVWPGRSIMVVHGVEDDGSFLVIWEMGGVGVGVDSLRLVLLVLLLFVDFLILLEQ